MKYALGRGSHPTGAYQIHQPSVVEQLMDSDGRIPVSEGFRFRHKGPVWIFRFDQLGFGRNNRTIDEFWVWLFTCGSDFISVADFDGVIPIHHYSFTYPVPIERIWMRSTNESDSRGPWITTIGF